jgi:hypothetical protein
VFNIFGEIQSQLLLPVEKKTVINNQLPLDLYNEQLKKYIFYTSGKPNKYWGCFLWNFENNELKYEEIKVIIDKK